VKDKTVRLSLANYERICKIAQAEGVTIAEVADSLLGENIEALGEVAEKLGSNERMRDIFGDIADEGTDEGTDKRTPDWAKWGLAALVILNVIGAFRRKYASAASSAASSASQSDTI
jgi:hypothetical protein